MKLAYITNARIPSERANALQSVQMCAAFAAAGAEVTLYYPARRNLPSFAGLDVWDYYGVPRTFIQRALPCVDWFHLSGGHAGLERPIFLLQTITFALALTAALWRQPIDVYYSRDPIVLAWMAVALPWARRRMFFEAHTFPTTALARALRRWVLSRVSGVVTISHALQKLYAGLRLESLITAPDGVDLGRFSGSLSQREARQKLGLTLDRKLVVYAGGLYAGRGLEELIVAVKPFDVVLVIVGGQDKTAEARLRNHIAEAGAANVQLVGHRPPTEIPLYLNSADILVMPYSRRTLAPGGVTTDWMSPLKMFEYMAAARPIIASDLPALREVLNEDNALLIPPDDPAPLAAALRRLLNDVEFGKRLAACARRDAQVYTWESRARRILEFARTK